VDTTTLAYHLVKREGRKPLFVCVDYGQKARQAERRLARLTAENLGCDVLVLDLPFYEDIAESYILEDEYEFEVGAQFWLEGRNVLIAFLLAVLASKHQVRNVYMASHKPLGGWAEETYPDATRECYEAINRVIEVAFKWHSTVVNPFIEWDWDKSDIIRYGQELGVQWENTITCCAQDVHCWSCEACSDRTEAFRRAGIVDPLASR